MHETHRYPTGAGPVEFWWLLRGFGVSVEWSEVDFEGLEAPGSYPVPGGFGPHPVPNG